MRALRYPQPPEPIAEPSGLYRLFSASLSNELNGDSDCEPININCATKRNPAKIDSPDIYEGFLDAYVLMKEERYAEALAAFAEYDRGVDLASPRSVADFSLPYFAMTVSDSEMDDKLPDMLAIIDKLNRDKNFDHMLARAVIYGAQGDVETSLRLLLKAFHGRPHTKWRPVFSWYQLTETAEWLYQRTGDKRFINHALQWVRSYQVIQPQFARAYAFEALYSNNESDRIRASGYATYLDSQSQWLSRVPAPVREKGRLWWEKDNPYPEYKERLLKPEASKKAA